MSKNYKCAECGRGFDNPASYAETHGLDTPPYETTTGCPVCGGAYDEARECDICGRLFKTDDIPQGICERCTDEADEGYTEELGRRFLLLEEGREAEFYIEYAARMGNHDCNDPDLLELLKAHERIILEFSDKLQEFCMEYKDNLAAWREFYHSQAARKPVV